MYTSFFGFKENPFNLTPDPRYLFLSPYHKEALDHLLYGINERKGFIAITGGIGTGKTTLCRALLSHLDATTKSALILNAFISDLELLKAVNQEFGLQMGPEPLSKKDYIDTLNQFLLKNFGRGGNAVLLVDEAQNLSHAVLEQIRMLSNLETEREKLILSLYLLRRRDCGFSINWSRTARPIMLCLPHDSSVCSIEKRYNGLLTKSYSATSPCGPPSP